jgi:hypothetical protein
MNRKENWPDLLLAEIERHGALPFEYGKSDCITFACDCVKAMTGEDIMSGQRGYKTFEDGMKRLRRIGAKDIGEAFASKLDEIPVALAGRGDVGVVEGNELTVGVVIVGPHAVGKETPGGVAQVPLSAVSRAFRVP